MVIKAVDIVWEELYSPITEGQRCHLEYLIRETQEYDKGYRYNLPAIIVKKDYKQLKQKLTDIMKKKEQEHILKNCIHTDGTYTETEEIDHGDGWDIIRIETIYVKRCSTCNKVLRKYRLRTRTVEITEEEDI